MSTLGSRVWRLRLARWPRRPKGATSSGYALVVPVPGDLPVFTHLALAGCARQSARHRVETIVVPDRPDPRVTALIGAARESWSGPLREVLIRHPERELLPRLGNAGHNHGHQILTAVHATAASHVILHDADLFLPDDGAHDRQWTTAVERDLDVLGVSPAWDPWFAARGRLLAATWEMVARVDWLRRFPPWQLVAHQDTALGEQHVFDTTFFTQVQTDPARIAVEDDTGGFVHFNYLISDYRRFVHQPATFRDDRFVLLVIRMLSDLFLPGSADPALPDLPTLLRGLSDDAGRVTYLGVPPGSYARPRGELEAVLRGPWSDPGQQAAAARALAPFDEAFGWRPGPESAPAPAATVPPADVTVVIAVKDRAVLLAAALESAFAQRPAPAEVIVVDDGSSDGSGDVARSYGATVIRHEVAQRQGPARNAGMAAASTTWVALLDSDDVWLPGHLAGLLQVADGHLLATAPGRTTDGGWLGNPRGRGVPLDPARLLVPGDGLVLSGTMVRRAEALAVGGFPPTPLCEDFALWLRLLDIGSGVETGHPTVVYRRHEGQMSNDLPAMRAAVDAVVEEFTDRPWYSPRLRRRSRSRLVWDELRAAQRAGDRRAVLDDLRWFAARPDVAPALAALLTHRRLTRLAAARAPHVAPLTAAAVRSSTRSGDLGGAAEAGIHPPA